MLPDYLIDFENWLRSIGWEPFSPGFLPPDVAERWKEPDDFDWGGIPEFWRNIYRWTVFQDGQLGRWGGEEFPIPAWEHPTLYWPPFGEAFPPPPHHDHLPDGTPVTLDLTPMWVGNSHGLALAVSLTEPFTNCLFTWDPMSPQVLPLAADLSHLVRALRELTELGYLDDPVTMDYTNVNPLPADAPIWFANTIARSPHNGFDDLLPWYRRLP